MPKIHTNIEQVPIGDLKPYSGNARKHSEEQIFQIMESVKLTGWADPLLIDQNSVIIAGHGRLEAAKKLGMKKVPCLRMKLNKTQSRALRIAHNKIASNSRWDQKTLRTELALLHNEGFDLSYTGFSVAELEPFQLDITEDEDGVTKLEPVNDSGRKIKVKEYERSEGQHIECPECGHKFLKG